MSHDHSERVSGRRLLLTMILNFLITVVEVAGGLIAGSLSLIADALHNFSDGIAIIISYIAIRFSRSRGSKIHTFGLKRAEILAAVINSSVLLILSFYLFYEAFRRLVHPTPVDGFWMAGVGGIGLVANVVGTLLLREGAGHSLNIRSAYLHLLSDAASSLAVVAGGIVVHLWRIIWIDPVLTVLIGLYVLKESFSILAQTTHILMEGAPAGVDLEALRQTVESFDGVHNLHHLHVWTVGENDVHLEGHLEIEDMLVSESDVLLRSIEERLRSFFGIEHITLQVECGRCSNVELIKE